MFPPSRYIAQAADVAVAVSVATTFALATVAPEESIMVPSRVAFTACPESVCEKQSTKRTEKKNEMDLSPRDVTGSFQT